MNTYFFGERSTFLSGEAKFILKKKTTLSFHLNNIYLFHPFYFKLQNHTLNKKLRRKKLLQLLSNHNLPFLGSSRIR